MYELQAKRTELKKNSLARTETLVPAACRNLWRQKESLWI